MTGQTSATQRLLDRSGFGDDELVGLARDGDDSAIRVLISQAQPALVPGGAIDPAR